MKIQQIRKAAIPKYAAVLAAAALLPVLTGCGKQPEIMGVIPVPVSESDTLMTTESTTETEVTP